MSSPAHVRALFNKSLGKEIGEKHLRQANYIVWQLRRTEEDPPTLKPILTGGRPAEPHSKAITNAECGKHAGTGIGHERSVIVLQCVAADEDGQKQHAGYSQTPNRRMGNIGSACCVLNQGELRRSHSSSLKKLRRCGTDNFQASIPRRPQCRPM